MMPLIALGDRRDHARRDRGPALRGDGRSSTSCSAWRRSSRCGGGGAGRSRSRCSRSRPRRGLGLRRRVPGLIALFNVALRGSRRAILIATALGARRRRDRPRSSTDDPELPYVFEVAAGASLITLVVIPWGLFTRTQRDLLRSSHERARAARGRAARARRAGARGRAAADRGRDARRARAPALAAERPRGRARVPPGRAAGGDRRGGGRDPRDRARARCRTCAR